MINYMNIEDLEKGTELLNKHIKDFDFAKNFTRDNSMYYRELLKNLIKEKTVIISKNNGDIDGVLICAKLPNLLDPFQYQLHILVNWVREDKRGSSVFYRLNNFLDKEFKNIDKIYVGMPGITNVNFEKLGYKEISISYIKEKEC